MAIIEKMKNRFDGFLNAISSIGTSSDVGANTTFSRSSRLSETYIDSIYAESAIFAKIIDLYPKTALGKWITYNHDESEMIDEKIAELGLISLLTKAGIKDRKDGGAVLYCDADDGQEHDTKLNLENIRAFNSIKLIEGRYVEPVNPDRSRNPKDGLYRIQAGGDSVVLHESRLLIFSGIEVSEDYVSNNLGVNGSSISTRIHKSIARYEMGLNNVSSLSSKVLVGVWKIDDLNGIIETDDDSSSNLKARFKAKTLGVSMANDVVIDSMDNYELLSPNLSGLKDIITPSERDLVAVSGIPHTVLLGESPGSSMSGAGGSQNSDWNRTISTYQMEKYQAPIEKVLAMITGSLGLVPVQDVKFPPLEIPTDKERAETQLILANADSVRIADDILHPREIRDSRYSGEFSFDVMLDESLYNDDLDLERLIDESEQAKKKSLDTTSEAGAGASI